MKEIPGDSQRTGQVLTHQRDHHLLLYSRRSRMSTGRALHKNVLDTDIHTSRPRGTTEPECVGKRESLKNKKCRKKCSCILTFSLEKYFHNFLWYTVTEKIFTNVLIDVFTNILRAAFKVYSYSFIFTDYNHNSVITTSQISEYSGDY